MTVCTGVTSGRELRARKTTKSMATADEITAAVADLLLLLPSMSCTAQANGELVPSRAGTAAPRSAQTHSLSSSATLTGPGSPLCCPQQSARLHRHHRLSSWSWCPLPGYRNRSSKDFFVPPDQKSPLKAHNRTWRSTPSDATAFPPTCQTASPTRPQFTRVPQFFRPPLFACSL